MFGKLKKRVGDLARQVAAAAPGAQERPAVDTFKQLWLVVQEEHSELVQRGNVDLDDPKLLGKTNIPDNLDAMVSILIREDWGLIRDTNTSPQRAEAAKRETHGPLKACLEFTLENRVLIDLCAKGLADRPRGMMSLILVTLHRVLDKVRHPLLPYKSAHQPLCQLIRVSAEVGSANARERLVALLKTLWLKMRQDPSQLEFFYSAASATRQEELDMFLALLPFVLEDSDTGERARYAALCAGSICDLHLLDYIANHTAFCATLARGLNDAFAALLYALAAQEDAGGAGTNSEDAAVARAATDLRRVWLFCNALTLPTVALGGCWESVLDGTAEPDADSQLEKHGVLAAAVVAHIEEHVLRATVVPAMLETSEASASRAMLVVVSLLRSMAQTGQELHSPLLWALVSMLVSTHLDADLSRLEDQGDTEGAGETRLKTTLLFCLDSMAPHLSIAALKLFSALLDLNDPRILHSLVMRQLYPGLHLTREAPGGSGGGDSATLPVGEAPGRAGQEGRRRPGGNAVEFLDKYPGSPKPPAVGSRPRKHISAQEQQELIAFEAYLTDGQGQAAAKIAAFASQRSTTHTINTSPAKARRRRRKPLEGIEGEAPPFSLEDAAADAGDGDVQPQPPPTEDTLEIDVDERSGTGFAEGLFLSLVFNKLERMLDSSLEENLVLTGILSKLAQCPHSVLHSYLFAEPLVEAELRAARAGQACSGVATAASAAEQQLESGDLERKLYVRPGVRTLAGVLSAVWKEALERVEDLMPDFEKHRASVRVQLRVDPPAEEPARALDFEEPGSAASMDGDLFSSGKLRFVQAYVVLEEFLKELASILQAKQNLVALQADLASQVYEN